MVAVCECCGALADYQITVVCDPDEDPIRILCTPCVHEIIATEGRETILDSRPIEMPTKIEAQL